MKKFSKRLLTFVLACAMVFGLSGMTTFAAQADEDAAYTPAYEWYVDGTSPYVISTANDLAGLAEIVNGTAPSDVGTDSFEGKTIMLGGSIDMNPGATPSVTATTSGNAVTVTVSDNGAASFTPIGTAANPFLGTFNGDGNTISNLYVAGDTGYLGLFGAVGGTGSSGTAAYAVVEDFNLTGVVYSTNNGGDYVGAVCGKLNAGGTIQKIVSSVDVEAPDVYNVGGIVGFAGTPTADGYDSNPSRDNTKVLCCGNEGALVHGFNKVGGIVGEVAATVKYCYNNSWVLSRRTNQKSGFGGIAGYNGNNNTPDEQSIVAYCYNTGKLSSNGYSDAGTATARYYGGIVGWGLGGYGENEIYNCYNIGEIPVGYSDGFASITSGIEGACEVAIRNNYSGTDSINNYSGAKDQEKGIAVSDTDFKVKTRNEGDILANLGPYFKPDTTETVNDGYPILFWQAGEDEPTLQDLQITKDPDKTDYDGEVFDPTGMVVTATYSNNVEVEVPSAYVSWSGTYDSQPLSVDLTLDGGYTYNKDKVLTPSDTEVTIYFDGVPAEVTINGGEPSTKVPEKLDIDTPPTKTDYIEGEKFDPTGMTFTVTFDDKSTETLGIDDVTFDPDTDTPLTLEDDEITVSYTYNGVTVDTTQAITVTSGSQGAITIWINGVASELTYEAIDAAIEGATEQTFTYGSNSVTAKFVLLSDLIGIDYDFCSYTVTCSDGTVTTGLPTDTYLYKRSDTGVYRTAVNGGRGSQWRDDPTAIEVVIDHTWEDTVWTWADDYSSASASRTCSVCKITQTADAQIESETTQPSVDPTTGAVKAGITVYTATATFDDGTVVTDTKEYFISADGSITVVMNKGEGDQATSELPYSVITDCVNAADPQEFTYTSGASPNHIIMPFVPITDILNINTEETPFCSYYVKSDVDNYEIHLPESACMYIRDDSLVYRTAVNGSYGRLWVNSPTYIEVDFLHNWSDVEWTWADDYSSATATATCHVDSGRGDEVCGKTEEVTTTDITHTTTATATKDGVTTYTASATFSDGQVLTGTTTVDTPAVDPTGYITIVNGADTFTVSNETIDAAIEAAEEQTFTYTSHGAENSITKQFVLVSDLTGIKDVCSYKVTASDEYFVGNLPGNNTYLYWRDDDACYRTAVNGGTGSQWANSPATFEVTLHEWGDVTWEWADDYSSATASRTCSVCETTETVDATITTETTPPTPATEGATVYTATATFDDGTEVTDERTVPIPPTGVTPTVSVKVTSTLPDNTKTYDGVGVSLTATATVTPDTAEAAYQWYTVDESGTETAIVDATYSVLNIDGNVSDSGTYLCIVTATNDGLIAEDSDQISITITPATQDISYGATLVTKFDNDDNFTNPLTETTVFGEITYASSNESVATVDAATGEVTIVGAGTTTITATAAGSDNYEEAEASYTLIVNTSAIQWEIDVNGEQATWDGEKEEYVADLTYTGDPVELEMVITLDAEQEEELDAITYQWYRYVPETTEYEAIEGATDAALTIEGEEVDTGNHRYMCVADVSYKNGDADTIYGIIEITITADKAALQAEYDEDSELNEVNYTADSWAPFAAALKDAQDVLDDPDASQDDVDTALKALQDAKAGLVEVTVDKTKLEEEIATAGDLVESDYTEDSWAAFELILAAAEAVDADPDATQSDVDEAVEALQDAIDALEAVPADKTELEEEIESTDDLVESDYTADSWAALEEALAAAEAANADPNALQSEVEAAAEALKTAIDNLEPVGPEVKNGLLKDSDGVWRLYKDNVFQRDYNGFAENANGKWYVERGIVTFTKTDILKDQNGAIGNAGDWYYVIDSKVREDFTGLSNFSNQYGWWYIEAGKVDFTRNSVDKNKNGWWYVVGGKVQFGFTGLANYKNQYGWWYIEGGKVNFNHNGVEKNKNGWYYVVGSKVQFDFTGLAHYRNDHGWWYIEGGKVNFNHTGVEKNQNGWWYVKDSKVDFSYSGTASNRYGTWNIVNGKVWFS